MEGKTNFRATEAARYVQCVRVQPAQGAASWFYVRVSPEKKRSFELALARGSVDMADFGDVLASGYGDTPPSHVVWAMENTAQ